MGFKLSQPNFHNSDQENVDEVIRSLDVQQKPLDEDVIAEANNDGSMYIDDNVDIYSEEGKAAIAHEQVHHDQMKRGDLNYDEDFVYWKDTAYPREGMNEGSENLAWEKEAYEKEKDVFDRMFTKNK